MADHTQEQKEAIEQIASTTDRNYEFLLKQQERIFNRLDRALRSDTRNTQLISALQRQLDGINTAIDIETEAFADLHDKLVEKAGGIKEIDMAMLDDLAKFEKLFVESSDQISKLQIAWDKEQEKLRNISDMMGHAIAGHTQAEVDASIANQQRIKNAQNYQSQRQIDALNAIENRYEGGKNSYAYQAAEEFTRDTEAQKKLAEAILNTQTQCIDKEKELLEAEKAGNKELERRREYWDVLQRLIGVAKDGLRKTFDIWTQFDNKAFADAKRLGLENRKAVQSYRSYMMATTKELQRNFGMNREDALKLYDSYSRLTGKAVILNKAQLTDMASATKLLGEDTVENAIKMIDNVGGTQEQAMEAIDKTWLDANRSGLDAKVASETFLNNMSLANKLTFRNGVEGIRQMSLLSQKIKLDLSTVESVAGRFNTIEDSIKNSAQLQMLGGSGAMYGGNPMEMMYEALSDPEALYKRTGKMFASHARWDTKRGESVIDPMEMAFLQAEAEAMGVSKEDAVKTAKQQAKLGALDNAWKSANGASFANATEEQRASIENRAQYSKESGWTVTYMADNGSEKTVGLNQLDPQTMSEIMQSSDDDVHDIRGTVRRIAGQLSSFQENREGIKGAIGDNAAQVVNKPLSYAGDLTNEASVDKKSLGGQLVNFLTNGIPGMLTAGVLMAVPTLLNIVGGKISKRVVNGKMVSGSAPTSSAPPSGPAPSTSPSGPAPSTQPSGPNPPNGPVPPTSSNGLRLGARMRLGRIGANKFMRSGIGKAGGVLAVGSGIYTGYEGWHEADENYQSATARTNNLAMSGRISANEQRQRQLDAENNQSRQHGEAIGEGVGTAAGGVAGLYAGAAVGTAIGGPIGTVAGAIVGGAIGMIGGYLGKRAGGALAKENHEKDDTIHKELEAINEGDADDNIKKIVLPVESIDYNVALIANQLGIISAMPARGNVYLEAEANGEIGVSASTPNVSNSSPVASDNGVVYQNTSPSGPVTGNLSLNVSGAIELKLSGSNVGTISANELAKMIENNNALRSQIVDAIMRDSNLRDGGSKFNKESAHVNKNTVMGR